MYFLFFNFYSHWSIEMAEYLLTSISDDREYFAG